MDKEMKQWEQAGVEDIAKALEREENITTLEQIEREFDEEFVKDYGGWLNDWTYPEEENVKSFYRQQITELVKELIPGESAEGWCEPLAMAHDNGFNCCREKMMDNAKSLGINLD